MTQRLSALVGWLTGRQLTRVFLLFTLLVVPAAAQEVLPRPKLPPTPRVGAYYFYWYRYPSEHFTDPDGSDALFQHFTEPRKVDYRSVTWHRQEIEAMMEAGLDFLAPVYWGIPDRKLDKVGLEFADLGLETLVKAIQEIRAAGGEPPLISMFYDTSTLKHQVRGDDLPGTLDLRTDKGFEVFSNTIINFFAHIPEDLRFKLGEFLVVSLYSSFDAPHERDFLVRAGDHLKVKLGSPVFFVAEESWRARAHARYRWGSALWGPTGDPVVQTLGPGYNDTPVPNRGTPVRDREEGRFYLWSWNRVLLARPSLVFIETWNEFHEGTGIAPCTEYGDTYVAVTRRMAQKLRGGLLPDVDRPVRLAHPDPLPRPDTAWWKGKPEQSTVTWSASTPDLSRGDGLRLARCEDGPFRREHLADQTVVSSAGSGEGTTYLYFGIADEFARDTAGLYEIEVVYVDGGGGKLGIQYDSWDVSTAIKGAYKSTDVRLREGIPAMKTATFKLADARFSNRQNGGCDFRLVILGPNLSLSEVRLKRL